MQLMYGSSAPCRGLKTLIQLSLRSYTDHGYLQTLKHKLAPVCVFGDNPIDYT